MQQSYHPIRKNQKRNCKFGSKCLHLKNGACKFYHPEQDYASQKAQNLSQSHQFKKQPSKKQTFYQSQRQSWQILDEYLKLPSHRLHQIDIKALDNLFNIQNFLEHNYDKLFLLFANIIATKNQRQKLLLIELIKNKKVLQEPRLMSLRQKFINQNKMQVKLNQFIVTLYYWIYLSNFYIEKYTSSFYIIPATTICKILEGLSKRVNGYRQLAIGQLDKQIVNNFDSTESYAKKLMEKVQSLKRQPPPPPVVPSKQENKGQQIRYPSQSDFRLLNACPTPQELLLKENKEDKCLNKLIIKGAYQSLNDYLDCNFRLLKQDFARQLRQGVHDYIDGYLQKSSSMNIKIYKGCRLFQFHITQNSTYMILRIPSSRHKKWHKTKDLKFGSLLVLSFDNFQKDIHFGVIKQRDQRQMNKTTQQYGCVYICVELHQEALNNFQFYSKYISRQLFVIEPKVFFEAYYHVLNCLKQIEHLPFEQIILNPNQRPLYYPEFMNQSSIRYVQNYIGNNSFDESQARSIKYCFNHQISLIQGPPGTGKTYVGVHIVNILLNILKRKARNQSGPIFIVCFTNHALDQFLEKLQQYTNDIIRIGGRSKNQSFKQYSLVQVKQNKMIKRRKIFYKIRDQRNELMHQINSIASSYFYYLQCGVASFKMQNMYVDYPIQIQIKKAYDYYYKSYLDGISNHYPTKYTKFDAYIKKLLKKIEFPEILMWLQILSFDSVFDAFMQQQQLKEQQRLKKLRNKKLKGYQQQEADQDDQYGILEDQYDKYQENLKIKNSWDNLQFLQMKPLVYIQGQNFQTYRQLIQFNVNRYEAQAL